MRSQDDNIFPPRIRREMEDDELRKLSKEVLLAQREYMPAIDIRTKAIQKDVELLKLKVEKSSKSAKKALVVAKYTLAASAIAAIAAIATVVLSL